MKTLKIIIFAAVAMFSMVSCSDKKKALDFVSNEVVADSDLTNFLVRNKALMFMDSFEPEIRYYLNSISDKKWRVSPKQVISTVYLQDEFSHYHVNRYNSSIVTKIDSWYYYTPNDRPFDSDRILNTILLSISERLNELLNDTTLKLNYFTSNGMTKDRLFNYILSKAAHHCDWTTQDERDSLLANYGLEWSVENVQMINYDWLVMGLENKQMDFVGEIVSWIISKSCNEVNSKNYKLVDKQCTETGENQYTVTYLLEPQLEIDFAVKKVGKTFVCENYSIDGNIFNL